MPALCIDVGTSMIKSVAFDGDGREVALARQGTKVLRPAPGHAEQDMDEVWDAALHTLRTTAREIDGAVDVIALTAQGDGCWLVDADGEPVGPAALWSDGRNPGVVGRWERDGTIDKAFAINGSLTFPGLPNAILPWLREHEPERIERAHKALYCGGWIFLKLTGEFAVDESDASAPLLDVRKHEYSPELLKLYDLEWARDLLPDVRPMDRRVGELSRRAAGELGLPAGLPVVMAPYDIASTAIGAGGLLFLPYLSPAGERAPFLDPGARGVFMGLSFDHDREHVARAVMEGLSHLVRDCLEAAPAASSELRLCGGGANSDMWCQLIADVTGVETLRSTDTELGAKGAFITALVATGAESDVESAAGRLVRLRDRFTPRADREAVHGERFEQFRALRDDATPTWRRLAGD